MNNGIDQGETMSPILWVIYYDPVFSMIKKQRGIGYKMEHKWKKDINSINTSKIEIEIFNIAFMDDTTWLGKGKRELEKQLEIADKFNRFNGIKVNPNKSKLIVINNKKGENDTYIKYGLNETLIYPEKKEDSTRFLGVWIGAKNNKNFVKKQVKKDVETIHLLARGKIITAEQMTYVINAVAIPRIESKMNLTIFNRKEADEATTKLRKLLRYKIGITNTSPNVLLSNKEIFNLIDLYSRQKEKQITELELRLNDKHDLGVTMEIRNRQLQTREHLHDNPLEVWNYNNVNMFKNSLLAQILCLMNEQGLSISYVNNEKENYTIEGGYYPLIMILKNRFRKEIKSLKRKGLLYLDQIIYKDSMLMKEWKNLRIEKNIGTRGRKPNWWKQVKKEVVNHNKRTKIIKKKIKIKQKIKGKIKKITKEKEVKKIIYSGNELKEKYINRIEHKINTTCGINEEITYITEIDGRKIQWIAMLKNNNTVIFGKLITKKNNIHRNNKIKIRHYNSLDNKKGYLYLIECNNPGCKMGLREN